MALLFSSFSMASMPQAATQGRGVAIVAPAFIGQFGKSSTPEKFTTAMKMLGFDRVVEVAVGADMCTIEEAEDFSMKVPAEQDNS